MPQRINASSISTVRCWMHTIKDGAADLLQWDFGSDLISVLLDHLAQIWRDADEGLWEIRGPPQHFTHSKMMAWVAFDRAVKLAEQFDLPGPADRWKALRQTIHDDVCAKAFNAKRGAFVQYY